MRGRQRLPAKKSPRCEPQGLLPGPTSPTPALIGDTAAAAALLRSHAVDWAGGVSDRVAVSDVLATALMDLFRRTGSGEVFEALVRLSHDQLLRRVRSRTRYLGERVDADELVQDAFINIYRYPDRFDAGRPGAFKAWSSTIVDNAIRRHLRRAKAGPDVRFRPVEVLAQEPDRRNPGPGQRAMDLEAYERAASAYCVFLALYLQAYHDLSSRERFVLQMVEVRGMRYVELAEVLGIRPEALKMVVFRARKRIFQRVSALLSPCESALAGVRSCARSSARTESAALAS